MKFNLWVDNNLRKGNEIEDEDILYLHTIIKLEEYGKEQAEYFAIFHLHGKKYMKGISYQKVINGEVAYRVFLTEFIVNDKLLYEVVIAEGKNNLILSTYKMPTVDYVISELNEYEQTKLPIFTKNLMTEESQKSEFEGWE